MRIMHLSRATLMIRQFLLPVIDAQKKQGHYICVCGSEDSDADYLRGVGIDVFSHNLTRTLNPIKIIKAIKSVKQILIEQKIDVLICHSPLGAGIGRIAGHLANIPNVIYFAHGLPCAPGQNPLKWILWHTIEKILGRWTTAIIVMNSYDERLCKSDIALNSSSVYRINGMGVNLESFDNSFSEQQRSDISNELTIPLGQIVVLCVAWLTPEKGVYLFLEAARKICLHRKDISFLLAGSGPEMEKLKKLCSNYWIEDRFKILGWRNDINKLMRYSDIFVLPSYYFEGLPVSILEAMACGKPVITTRHRGCQDAVLDSVTGFLVPIKQSEPIVEKIVFLADNKLTCTKMGFAGRKRVEEIYSLQKCTEEILEIMGKIFAQNS